MTVDEAVWRALGSPVRREILDLLRSEPRTTGAVAAALPGLSRYAVMQHLGVLEAAELVVVRRQGRERFNHINAVPLHEIYERWVSRFASAPAAAALALKRHVEGEEAMSDSGRAVRIENEIRLRASRERVFAAMTTEQMKWYPHNYGGERLKAIVFEERVGGQVYEDWGDGCGILYGTVTYFDAPKAVSMRGNLKGGVTLEHWFVFETDGGETVMKQSLTAFGPISDVEAAGIREHGDLKLVEPQLRAYVEA